MAERDLPKVETRVRFSYPAQNEKGRGLPESFMKSKYIILGIVDLIVWYIFTYYIIYALQNLLTLNPWWAAFVLVILGAIGTVLCPWFQNTDGWRRLVRGE